MDDKDKNFEKDLVNNLDQQRAEMAAGAEIEAIQEQRAAEWQEETVATGMEREAEAAAGARVEEQVAKIGPMNGTQAENGGETAGRRPMSEAEAKALLMEETQKTEQKLAKAHKNNQKIAIIAVIIAVVLCVAGVVLALVIGNRTEEDKGGDKGQIGTPVADEDEKKPDGESEEPKDEIVAMSVDDPLVQRLYGNFVNVGGAYSSTLDFYTDKNVQNGKVDKMMMLDIALGNSAQRGKDCKAKHYVESGTQSYEVGEMFGCREGKEARDKVQEIFGTVIELDDGDKTGEYCGAWMYDAQNDEFYVPSLGCGGSCLYALTRELTGAERYKNNIYLYETAYGGSCLNLTTVDGTVIAEAKLDDNGSIVENVDVNDYRDKLEQFRWTFTKNESGEYIFTGLERVK